MPLLFRTCVAAAVTLLAAGHAQAQQTTRSVSTRATTQAGDERVQVSVDFGAQGASPSFASSFTAPLYLETETLDTRYPFKTAPQLNVGGSYRLWSDFGIGVRLSYGTQSDTAGIDARIPHPFFFNQPRSLSADQTGVNRQETGVHVELSWMIHINRRLDVTVQGGPSFVFVKQDIVTGVNYTDDYPHDTVAFTSSTLQSQSKHGTGFNAGIDVAYMFQPRIGVGGSVSFSRAQVQFDLPAGGSQPTTVKADVGGPQYAAGLRLRF